MNKDINSQELDLIKEQYTQLKNLLDKERILNERIMRRTMREKANKLNRRGIMFAILAIFMTPFVIFTIPKFGIHPFYGYTGAALILIGSIYEIFTVIGITKVDFTRSSLIEISEIMTRYKQRNIRWLYFSIPYVLLWITGMLYEGIKIGNIPMVTGICVGFIVGAIIGIRSLIKTHRTATEIIDASHDLMA